MKYFLITVILLLSLQAYPQIHEKTSDKFVNEVLCFDSSFNNSLSSLYNKALEKIDANPYKLFVYVGVVSAANNRNKKKERSQIYQAIVRRFHELKIKRSHITHRLVAYSDLMDHLSDCKEHNIYIVISNNR